jgi:hypothetical protein
MGWQDFLAYGEGFGVASHLSGADQVNALSSKNTKDSSRSK